MAKSRHGCSVLLDGAARCLPTLLRRETVVTAHDHEARREPLDVPSNGPGNVSSKSLMSKTNRRSAEAYTPKFERYASPHSCPRRSVVGVSCRWPPSPPRRHDRSRTATTACVRAGSGQTGRQRAFLIDQYANRIRSIDCERGVRLESDCAPAAFPCATRFSRVDPGSWTCRHSMVLISLSRFTINNDNVALSSALSRTPRAGSRLDARRATSRRAAASASVVFRPR